MPFLDRALKNNVLTAGHLRTDHLLLDPRLENDLLTGPKLHITASRTVLPAIAEPQWLYLLITVQADGWMTNQPLPLNICLVVDRSTSMRGERLDELKDAAGQLMDGLGEEDSLSLIAFSDRAEVVIPSERPVNRALSRARLSVLHAGGGTEILQGLSLGLREVRTTRRLASVNHIILLTDGQTYGDEDGCLALADEAREEGIGISALGIGDDWNDTFLDALAGRTGGVAQFARAAGGLSDFLHKRIRSLAISTSDPMQVSLRLPADSKLNCAFRLEPEPQWLDHNQSVLVAGPVSENRPARLLVEALIQPQPTGQQLSIRLQAQNGPFAGPEVDLTLPVGSAPLQEIPPLEIREAVSILTLYRMQELARQDAERGQVEQASARLESLAQRLESTGQTELAQTARFEARRLGTDRRLSRLGAKHLKFGTRALLEQTGREKVREKAP